MRIINIMTNISNNAIQITNTESIVNLESKHYHKEKKETNP